MQTALHLPTETDAELILVPGTLEIGQAEGNDIQLDAQGISQYHAKIVTYFQESYLIDLSSETGTYLNGERIIKHSLKSGDVIQLGNYRFMVKAPSEWFY